MQNMSCNQVNIPQIHMIVYHLALYLRNASLSNLVIARTWLRVSHTILMHDLMLTQAMSCNMFPLINL